MFSSWLYLLDSTRRNFLRYCFKLFRKCFTCKWCGFRPICSCLLKLMKKSVHFICLQFLFSFCWYLYLVGEGRLAYLCCNRTRKYLTCFMLYPNLYSLVCRNSQLFYKFCIILKKNWKNMEKCWIKKIPICCRMSKLSETNRQFFPFWNWRYSGKFCGRTEAKKCRYNSLSVNWCIINSKCPFSTKLSS